MKLFNLNNLYILLSIILFIIVIILLIKKYNNYDNFETNSMVPKETNKVHLILFHSGLDICGECAKFSEIGNELNNTKIKDKTIIFKKINCLCEDEENNCDENKEKCEEFNIDSYPKIYLLKSDTTRVVYENIMDSDKIKKWISKNI